MLTISKKVLFPGHNHLPTTVNDVLVIIKVSGHQYWWLVAGGYDLEIGHFLEVPSMVTWCIVAFLFRASLFNNMEIIQ